MSDESGIDPEVEPQAEDGEAGEPKVGCLASLIPVTTPGCASLLTAIFLITTVITVWLAFWLDPDNIPWRHSYNLWRILAIVGIGATLPFVVYKTLKLWLEVSPKAFPELEYAWRAGMHALASNELPIDSVPLFLVTGTSGEAQEKAIMNASGLRFSVEGVPQGPAPIHWYANSEAIYLFCSDASWTSALASLREELAQEAMSAGLNLESQIGPSNFDVPTVPAASEASSVPMPVQANPERSLKGTLELNHFFDASKHTPSLQPAPSSTSRTEPASIRGTLILGDSSPSLPPSLPPTQPITYQTLSAPAVAPPPPTSPNPTRDFRNFNLATVGEADSKRKPILVSHQYSTACLQELQHLGQLVRQARQPVCAINGILALIQIESIHSPPVELEELQKALRGDMEAIRSAFQMRVPVCALIVGLEKERGFRELVLRVGRERALSQRFGKRFDVQAIPTKEELNALAIHICGVFEDWAYALFREEESLIRTGNTRLYELLSKVRCGWKTRLGELLAGGFGCEPDKRSQENSLFMSGCYLAATGDTPDRQAFVKGVIVKLGEEQELIEWTQDALRSNRIQNIAASLGMFIAIGLLISLILMYLFLGTSS